MKYSTVLFAFGSSLVAAQSLSDLPPCGQACVNNMIGIASSQFGCKTGDVLCYCKNVNFGYGVRDCSNESCSKEDAAKVVSFGTGYCQNAINSAPGGGASATGTGGGQGGPASTPVTTSTQVVTITSGTQTTISTGLVTIYAPVSGTGTATGTDAISSIASAASNASNSASSASESASASASSASASASASASSASASASASRSGSSSGNAAPIQTAGPLLGAAGMAALLLI